MASLQRQPPKAPNPSCDNHLAENERAYLADTCEGKLVVESEDWDLSNATALQAIKLLISAVQELAEATGQIPPTPPASRPVTPGANKIIRGATLSPELVHSGPATPVSPISPLSTSSMPCVLPVLMPSPEAHRDEPLPEVEPATPQAVAVQQAAIARRFFLKSVPAFSLSQYLLRIHHYCPHSPGVYLVAASYIQRLCVEEALVPATAKTIHRLCLTAIRVASKAFEDHKWSQDRFAKVGGLSRNELKSLEINLCYLLDFELFVKEADLKKRIFALQQAALQGAAVRRRLSGRFRMELPLRV